ncbi:leucine-rich repeat-domain-containing protein [Chytridium lagenaria]|nr:leucine-rich repeat-domain-containing protein [Chytridium lagenaria]
MVKLDYEVLSQAPSYLDPVKDRALDLRGLKITKIENLAITKDQNDTIDFTNNDLRKLDNFPPMTRLKCLLLSNNRIQKIDPEVPKKTPNLTALILTNNQIAELGDLDVLSAFKELTHLSLMDNPVAMKKHYRLYVIFRCPKVRVLDFKHVWDRERAESKTLFASESGKQLAASLSSTKGTFEPGEGIPKKAPSRNAPLPGVSPEEAARIREAIKNASTLEEIERLKRQLEGGVVPGVKGKVAAVPTPSAGENDMEEDEDEE